MDSAPPPEVPILLLGDDGVGKSTFLSYVSYNKSTTILSYSCLLPI